MPPIMFAHSLRFRRRTRDQFTLKLDAPRRRCRADDVQVGHGGGVRGEGLVVSLHCSVSPRGVCGHRYDVPHHQVFAVITKMFRITPNVIFY